MLDTSELLDAVIMKQDPKKVEASLQLFKNKISNMLIKGDEIKLLEPADRIEELTQSLLVKIINQPYTKEEGKSYLHHTSRCHIDKVSKVLLDNGADPNIKDNKGNTPLHHIAQAYEEPLKTAIESLNPGTREYTYRIAENMVNQLLPTINLLTEYGADFKIKNNENKTPLDILCDSMIKVVNIKPKFEFNPELYIESYQDLSIPKEKTTFTKKVSESREKESKNCCVMM